MIKIDLEKTIGKIKPVHGINSGPLQNCLGYGEDYSEGFKLAGFPLCRTHDIGYPRGCGVFCDIHCIFPNFNADENDPESYDFHFTDKYIKGIIDVGSQVFYRLGESIDHSDRKDFMSAPINSLKWAKICEHIIAHYNEGWANGFQYDIVYWEIWNEPENSPMWAGTREQFFELYSVTANYLKKCFGETIKVGGYASCGFHALEEKYMNDTLFKECMIFFSDFIDYINSDTGKAPLDFFSFHIYSEYLYKLKEHTLFCRKYLDEHGFNNTEISLNEWNRNGEYYENVNEWTFYGMFLCTCQHLPIDTAMVYDCESGVSYNNWFKVFTSEPTKALYAFAMFNKLYMLKNEVYSECNDDDVTVCAACDGNKYAVMICNSGENRVIRFDNNINENSAIYVVDSNHSFDLIGGYNYHDKLIRVRSNSVMLITNFS